MSIETFNSLDVYTSGRLVKFPTSDSGVRVKDEALDESAKSALADEFVSNNSGPAADDVEVSSDDKDCHTCCGGGGNAFGEALLGAGAAFMKACLGLAAMKVAQGGQSSNVTLVGGTGFSPTGTGQSTHTHSVTGHQNYAHGYQGHAHQPGLVGYSHHPAYRGLGIHNTAGAYAHWGAPGGALGVSNGYHPTSVYA